jgi:AcrR family transcriptional regulator
MVPLRGSAVDSDIPLDELAVRRRMGPLQADAEQDVRRLLDSALELMQSGSMPRVADIVRKSGLSNDAFYRYFKTKDDLVAAIVDDGARRLLQLISQRLAKVARPSEQIRVAIRLVLRQATDPKIAVATRNVFGNSTRRASGGGQLGWSRMEAGLADLLTEPLARLGAGDPARDARAAAILIMGMMNHFLWQQGNPTPDDVEHLTDFVLRGAGVATDGDGVRAGRDDGPGR